MPVVIDEIVITIEVGGSRSDGNAPAATDDSNSPASTVVDRSALVAECVEKVMEVLRDRREP